MLIPGARIFLNDGVFTPCEHLTPRRMNVIRSVLQEELTGNSREAKIEQIDGQAQVVFSGILTIEHASQMKETLHNVLTGMEEELVN